MFQGEGDLFQFLRRDMMSHPRDKDGGWAWVILCACSVCVLMTSGLAMLAGMFQKVFLDEFVGDVVMVSWITSLFASLMQLAGPVTGVLCSVFSCRVSVMVGAVLLTAGLVLSTFCDNTTTLLLSFGLSSGLGLGLIYSAAIVAVNLSFVRYRPVATGSVLGAGGVGIMAMPALCQFLLESYGWRETLSILAAMSAQLVVAGALLFPADSTHNHTVSANNMDMCNIDGSSVSRNSEQLESKLKSESDNLLPDERDRQDPLIEEEIAEDYRNSSQQHTVTACSRYNDEEMKSTAAQAENVALVSSYVQSVLGSTSADTATIANSTRSIDLAFSGHSACNIHRQGSATKLPSTSADTATMANSTRSIDLAFSGNSACSIHRQCSAMKLPSTNTREKFCLVFKNPSLILLCLQLFLTNAAIGIMLVHFPEFCLQSGSDFQTVSLSFSMNGMTLTLSRFLMGFLAQDRKVDPLSVYVGLLLLASLFTVLTPLVALTPNSQIAVLSGLGLYFGGSYSLLSEITLQCTGVDTLSLAFGMEMIAAGLGFLLTPPIAGWLAVVTRSYGDAMFLAGFLIFLATFVAMAISVSRPEWNPTETSDVTSSYVITSPDEITTVPLTRKPETETSLNEHARTVSHHKVNDKG